ncbi:MAG: hypothetical protein WBM44_02120 [Waterburya sp.]
MERQSNKQTIIAIWKQSLGWLLAYYDAKRDPLRQFLPKLLLFFVVLNISCYWWAMLTAYSDEFLHEKTHYFLVQFPVGILGAVFDTLSFFVTIFIAKKALNTTSTKSYLAHLSVDLIIAIIATWWVLLVFSISGWLVSIVQQTPESFAERSYVYEQRFMQAIKDPTDIHNLKNIYFGVIMGISAMLPTFTHSIMSLYSVSKYFQQKKKE